MEYLRDDAVRERGGITVRDYTQGNLSYSLAPRIGKRGDGSVLGKVDFDKLARVLGVLSLGLGVVALLRPRDVQEAVGVRRDHTRVVQMLGIREIISAVLTFIQPRPFIGSWSRVLGGAVDLALLGAAFRSRRTDKDRLKVAAATLAGLGALDVLTSVQLTRQLAEERQYGELTREGIIRPAPARAFHVTKSITVNREPGVLYPFWRNFENLPKFMFHLEEVHVLDERRSHWVVKAPAGRRVEWDAEIIEDRPNGYIAWQALPGADVPNSGVVRFEPGPAGRGTVVHVEIEYLPPGGAAGRLIAKLFGEEPGQQVAGDLRRFKQVMETGEVVLSEGSPQGFGQKKQRPAQPQRGSFARARTYLSPEQQREQTSER